MIGTICDSDGIWNLPAKHLNINTAKRRFMYKTSQELYCSTEGRLDFKLPFRERLDFTVSFIITKFLENSTQDKHVNIPLRILPKYECWMVNRHHIMRPGKVRTDQKTAAPMRKAN